MRLYWSRVTLSAQVPRPVYWLIWPDVPVLCARLDAEDRARAHDNGTRRRDSSRRRGLSYEGTVPARDDLEQYGHEHRNMAARDALSTWLGTPFDPQLDVFLDDPAFGILGRYVVRTVVSLEHCLILRPKDFRVVTDRVYVSALVARDLGTVTFVGWTQGQELCRDEFWDNDMDAWRIPLGNLTWMTVSPVPVPH